MKSADNDELGEPPSSQNTAFSFRSSSSPPSPTPPPLPTPHSHSPPSSSSLQCSALLNPQHPRRPVVSNSNNHHDNNNTNNRLLSSNPSSSSVKCSTVNHEESTTVDQKYSYLSPAVPLPLDTSQSRLDSVCSKNRGSHNFCGPLPQHSPSSGGSGGIPLHQLCHSFQPSGFLPNCSSTPLPATVPSLPSSVDLHHHRHHHHHHPHLDRLPEKSALLGFPSHSVTLSVPTSSAVPPYEMAQSYLHCGGPSRSTSMSYHSPNHSKTLVYVYELPYNVRKAICDLLDADQTWRELGGRYMAFNDTQLTLFSHALYRSASPTNELLIKWESSNAKIAHLFRFLADMKHRRAMFHLLPFVDEKLRLLYETFDGEVFDSKHHDLAKASAPLENMTHEKELFHNRCSASFAVPSSSHSKTGFHHPFSLPPKVNTQELAQKNTIVNHDAQMLVTDDEKTLKNRAKQDYLIKIEDFEIPYKELAIAADDFAKDNILGSGGFGTVYIGEWKGTKVAIKKLNGLDNISQAVTELRVLNCCRIDNILPLYGVSLDGPEPCLVYQYMPNGSLENRLLCKSNTPPLTWSQRAQIAEGVARALNFLHTLKGNPFVHGDVKSANILLDAQYEPKLGDFGLARKVEKSGGGDTLYTHCTVSSVNGTSVYLPSEYLRNKILSPAVDVYSYGIVVLEMATGRRAYDGKRLLINSVEDEYSRRVSHLKSSDMLFKPPVHDNASFPKISESNLDALMDRRIVGIHVDRHWFNCLLELGRKCAHKTKTRRPMMMQVLEYFNQCKTTDRIHKLCGDSGTQSSYQQDRTTVTTPLELQLWYDFVRKSCGTLSEVVFENFGAQVTRMVEEYTGSTASSVSYHLDRLLNSQQTENCSTQNRNKIDNNQLPPAPLNINICPPTPTSLCFSAIGTDSGTSESSSSSTRTGKSEVLTSADTTTQNDDDTGEERDDLSNVQEPEESFIPLLTALGFKQD